MRVGYQVGQVVSRGSVDLQQQWRNQLEQFRASRDAGFDIYCWGHHYLIDPFQHFQPLPVLVPPGGGARRHETGHLGTTSASDESGRRGRAGRHPGPHLRGAFILGLGLGYRPKEFEAFA